MFCVYPGRILPGLRAQHAITRGELREKDGGADPFVRPYTVLRDVLETLDDNRLVRGWHRGVCPQIHPHRQRVLWNIQRVG
jgi:hypothetical protein